MFRYYDSNPEVPLYDPTVMRDFCEKHSPVLFHLLLKAITRDDNRLSSDRVSLQRQRTVSLLHILSYFRFVTNIFALKNNDCWSKILRTSACRMINMYPHIGTIKSITCILIQCVNALSTNWKINILGHKRHASSKKIVGCTQHLVGSHFKACLVDQC